MNAEQNRPVTLLVAALGGEGGGVLSAWIVAAAHAEGLPVQATSIPGVAQRTGATTYYIEIWPGPVSGKRPVLALSPAPGEVDVVATSEMLEAGRAITNGLVTPERTTLIASTHRVYTTHEKMAVGDGRFDPQSLTQAAISRAKSARLLNMEALAHESVSSINAVMLGVLAGAKALPLSVDAMRGAIQQSGKAVDANLRGFDAGLAAIEGDAEQAGQDASPAVQSLIDLALDRMREHQGDAYAELFLQHIEPFRDADPELLGEVVKGLARRMAYNDIIRIAQIKLRPGRLNQIKREAGASEADVVRVTEFFRPGINEIADILPFPLGRWLSAWAAKKQRRLRLSWPMAVRSNTITNFLLLRFLAALRPLRRISYRYKTEQAAIVAWIADIAKARNLDPALALEIAKNARLIKGYGDTHIRSQAAFDSIRDDLVAPALNGEAITSQNLAEARQRALNDRSA